MVPVERTEQQIDASDEQGYLRRSRHLRRHPSRCHAAARAGRVRPYYRYFEASPDYPPGFHRTGTAPRHRPAGTPKGAVVLLHGLTDSPYSLRHVARRDADRGFVAIGIRIPGHGTVPAGRPMALGKTGAPRPGSRSGRPGGAPRHRRRSISSAFRGRRAGGEARPRCDRGSGAAPGPSSVLFTPMIGITRSARFAGLAGFPPCCRRSRMPPAQQLPGSTASSTTRSLSTVRGIVPPDGRVAGEIQRLARAGRLDTMPRC